MPSASSRNALDSVSPQWFSEMAWVPNLRGALKGAIQERHPRDFVHALTVRPPFAVRWPKAIRQQGEFPLVLLARQGVRSLDDGQPGAGMEFLAELHEALDLPKRERRPRVREQVEAWGERLRSLPELQPADLLASLAALVAAGDLLPTRTFLPLWKSSADASRVFADEFSPTGVTSSLRQLLFQVELPCWIASVFWPLADLSEQDAGLDAQMSEALSALQGPDGSVHARFVSELPQWIGSLLRCLALDQCRETPRLSVKTRSGITDLVIRSTALLGGRGEMPWSSPDPETVPLLAAAARVARLSKRTATRQRLRELEKPGDRPVRSGLKPAARKRLRKLWSFQSDWGKTASLSSGHPESAARVVTRYHESVPEILAEIAGVPLLQGPWHASLTLDGERISSDLRWECSCWYSEPDADFAELSSTVRPGCQMNRQILLARKQGWLLLVDEVQAPQQSIEYSASIPLAAGWEALEDAATREFAFVPQAAGVVGPASRIRVCPLDLPQDKVHPAAGLLQCSAERVRLTRQARGGLYAATLIEWHPDNAEAGVDWNALTIAEDGRVLTSDEAAGFRIRIGERHLAFYHSLTRARIGRSVLGLHTLSETVAGTFSPTGIIEPLVEVEFGTSP